MKFENSYLDLGKAFYQQTLPVPVAAPQLLLWNTGLGDSFGLGQGSPDDEQKALIFSGNRIMEDSTPIALAYSGHQFGHFNPQLGDGRAHLLGELLDGQQRRFDVQLKGSGPTRFSRQGDGRCALKPALREFIMSEALHALKVPTSRCLAVVSSGETVYRETPQPGAIVTRIAQSHLRVGSFQHFASRGDLKSLHQLLDYAIARHYPNIAGDTSAKALQFLQQVAQRQIELICHWMRIGFIHGVMNTDNTAISGETIDYGPCAMMGDYHPGTVYSSIDSQGRYAYGNQMNIAIWNMARLAESLLPLLADDQQQAINLAETSIGQLVDDFSVAYRQMLVSKLGIEQANADTGPLIESLLSIMQEKELDYTQTFHSLTKFIERGELSEGLTQALHPWLGKWLTALGVAEVTEDNNMFARIGDARGEQLKRAVTTMKAMNPVLIPRNHHVETTLDMYQDAMLTGENWQQAETRLQQFLIALRSPYQQTEYTGQFQDAAADKDKGYRTFCGT
ncbi:protein adenylyltransferase SelO [Thalassotalea mangrovi]|uniref:Protein nucleotidyltransferase YdiU n=1 Tax=Thalassotalea mangrovi TaxID=2572245 RepID=A0A4U1B5F8_9GAMM|nr:YdiU family protein [Thalassotalea mangrovi]TKB45577.1 YdiU family protein [Thalassotalea mangrovi]